jgi:hypothetical protein
MGWDAVLETAMVAESRLMTMATRATRERMSAMKKSAARENEV